MTASGARLAVAAGRRLGLFDLAGGRAGLRRAACIWESTLPFQCQWMHFDEVERLWTGGHRPSTPGDSGDWNACPGGGIRRFAVDVGAHDCAVELPKATSWGYGADPISLTPDGREIYVLGRSGSLDAIDVATRAWRRPWRVSSSSPPWPSHR